MELAVNGSRDAQLTVSPQERNRGLLFSGRDVVVTLTGTGPMNRRLPVTNAGALVLETGQQVMGTGRGFLPNSTVTISSARTGSPDVVVLGTVTADAQGSVVITARLAATMTPGTTVLQVAGRTPRNEQWVLSVGASIRASITLDASTSRVSGARGDRIRVSGQVAGLPAGTVLTPHIRIGTGSTFTTETAAVQVSGDGTFTWGRTVPRGAVVTVYVSYRDSESNRVVIARLR